MTTPSGQISLGNVNAEIGAGGQRSLGDAATRDLAGVQGGQISLSQLHDKSAYVPPVENVEWRYDATMESANNSAGIFVKQNSDGSANALLSWDGVWINDGIEVLFYGDPSGQQWQHPDGRLFRIGAYQQQFPLFVGGPPFTNSYQIGLVTYS